MCRTHRTLYTERQLQSLFQRWQCTEPNPPKGQKVYVAFGGKADLDVDLAEVELSPKKGTYGDRLYKVTYSSRAGRAFEKIVQEAHVIAFAQHQAEQRRQTNLLRRERMLATPQ